MRGDHRPVRADTGRPVSNWDVYTMVMMYRNQRMPMRRIARRFGLTETQARQVISRRVKGTCAD